MASRTTTVAKPRTQRPRKPRAKRKAPAKKARSKARAPDAVLPPEFVDAQWKPGQSGNPAGRPKRKTFEEAMTAHLEALLPGDEKGRTRLEAMVEIVFSEGVTRRNPRVMVALLDRLYPKTLTLAGDPDNPILPAAQLSAPDLSQCSDDEVRQIIAARKILSRVSSPSP